ncbi:MAG: hypothetical protein H6747_15870 [Deltaproteobacteria bacterium]|nr:hypothetical protein [Deltaproteobacteria bacterium]
MNKTTASKTNEAFTWVCMLWAIACLPGCDDGTPVKGAGGAVIVDSATVDTGAADVTAHDALAAADAVDAGPCPHDGAPCDDGKPCTSGDVCKGGVCLAGVNLCQCGQDADCAVYEDGDLCNGTLRCDVAVFPYRCVAKAGSVVHCDDSLDTTCAKANCDPVTGACAAKPLPDGSACSDGDACSDEDRCAGGVCVGGALGPCACQTDSDCSAKTGGNLCAGTQFCDKSSFPFHCATNPASVPSCDGSGDTACTRNACHPADGACKPEPVEMTSQACFGAGSCLTVFTGQAGAQPVDCDDADPCTQNTTCAAGACQGGVDTCACDADADCAKLEDGDLCNGTLYCDKVGGAGTCKVNPATLVTCASASDTACVKNLCVPQTGVCVFSPLANGAPCDDGDACLGADICISGACKGTVNICPCNSDQDCTDKDDGNLCNGTGYCDPKDGFCKHNPAQLVVCPSANDTACNKNACVPMAGACSPTAVERTVEVCDLLGGGCRRERLPVAAPASGPHGCDDGDACTVGDECAAGACKSGTFACFCGSDADCAGQDDGDLCNGLPFCDKSDPAKPVCKPNPASAVVCKTVDDTACLKAKCQPKTGECTLEPAANGADCDDGKPCTKSDYCVLGVCNAGTDTCECQTNADCADKEDGNLCNGTLYCDKSQPAAPSCQLNPATVVKCPDSAPACQGWSCNPANGQCLLGPAGDGDGCDDNDACTSVDLCAAGACVGTAKNCDDGDACTQDGCSAGVCIHAKTACDDGNSCTLDLCDAKTGTCSSSALAQNGKGCDADGSGCTINDVCAAGVCKAGQPVLCAPVSGAGACQEPVCASTGASSFQCVLAAKADGGACDDGDACTLAGSCKSGTCQKTGKPRLYQRTVGLPWAATQALDVSADLVWASGSSDGALVAGRYASAGPDGPRGWWWSAVGADGAQGASCVLPSAGATAQALPLLALPLEAGRWRLFGSLDGVGGDLGLASVRVGADCKVDGLVRAGAADKDEIALAAQIHGTGVVVAGRRVDGSQGHAMVARLSAGGQLAWLWSGGGVGGWAADVLGRDDGGVLAVGAQGSGTSLGWIARLDAGGKLVGTAVHSGSSALRAVVDSGSGLLAVGSRASAEGERLVWVGMDTAGVVRWSRDGAIGVRGTRLVGAGAALLLVGVAGVGGTDTDFYAARVDDFGNIGWEFSADGGPKGGAAAAVSDAARTFIVGATAASAHATGLLVRTDAFGHTSCAAAGGCMQTTAATCDDGKGCTLDGCDGTTGCTHKPAAGWSCGGDGGGCSSLGSCSAGSCVLEPNGKLFRRSVEAKGIQQHVTVQATDGALAVVLTTAKALWMRRFDAIGLPLTSVALPWNQVPAALTGAVAMADGGVVVGLETADGKAYVARFDADGAQKFSRLVCAPDTASCGDANKGYSYLMPHCHGEVVASADGETALWTAGVAAYSAKCSCAVHKGCTLTRKVSLSSGVITANEDTCEWHPLGPSWQCGKSTGSYLVELARPNATADGGVLLAGGRRSVDIKTGEVSTQQAHLERRNTALETVWRRNYPLTGEANRWQVAVEANGQILAAGVSAASGKGTRLMVGRLAPSGSPLAIQIASSADGWAPAWIGPRNDGFVLTGVRSSTSAPTLWMSRFDTTLAERQSRAIEFDAGASGPFGWGAADQGFWLAGRGTAQGVTTLLLARADAWGHSDCVAAGGCSAKVPADCDDGKACSIDFCDGKTGDCVHMACAP